jgi:hypothetical protein
MTDWYTKNNLSWETTLIFIGAFWDTTDHKWDDIAIPWDARGDRKNWYNKLNTTWQQTT